MNTKILTLTFLALVLIIGTASSVFADDVEDTLREGETKAYELGDARIEVTALYVSDPSLSNRFEAKLMIAGEVVAGSKGSEAKAGCIDVYFEDIIATDREGVVKFRLENACDATMPTEGNYGTETVSATGSGTIEAGVVYVAPEPYPYEDDWFRGKLDKGRTAVYHRNGIEYELTLLWISNPYLKGESKIEYPNYDTDDTNILSASAAYYDGEYARFMLNGEVGENTRMGEYDKFECGIVRVDNIYSGITSNSNENVGAVAYSFRPYMCNAVPPDDDDYLRLREGETKTITVDRVEYEITALAIEQDEWKTSAAAYDEAMIPRWTAKVSVNGESDYVEEHTWANFDVLNFYVDDIDLEDEYIILTKFQHRIKPIPVDPPRVCTMEIKICPDGTSVGRNPWNNCAFRPCPSDHTTPEDCENGQWVCEVSNMPSTEPNCYCVGTDIPYPEPPVHVCDTGCWVDDRCVPIGTRLANGNAKYCDLMGDFQSQMSDGNSCQNNYECVSNQCLNAVCQSLDKEIKETKGLLTRVVSWFEGWFGNK